MPYSDNQLRAMLRNAPSPEVRQTIATILRSRQPLPSVRSDVFAAEMRTARTRAERREAIDRFMSSQRSAEEARFAAWLAAPEHGRSFEDRAIGEAGSALVPPSFYNSLIHQLKEFDGLLKATETWTSPHGEEVQRPVYSEFSSASAQATEGTAFTEGPYPVLAQQEWPQASTYAASFVASFQLVQDAFNYTTPASAWNPLNDEGGSPEIGTVNANPAPVVNPHNVGLDAMVSSALGESLGRAIAPVAQTALYSTISGVGAASGAGGYVSLTAATPVTLAGTASTELNANTIAVDTAAQMIGALDEAYLETASWYMSRAQWSGILRQQDAQKHTLIIPNGPRTLFDIPVVLTSQTTAAAASTVAGPVLGDLGAALTLRIVEGSFGILRSNEKYAENLQQYYRAWLRADVKARDARAVVGVKYAAS